VGATNLHHRATTQRLPKLPAEGRQFLSGSLPPCGGDMAAAPAPGGPSTILFLAVARRADRVIVTHATNDLVAAPQPAQVYLAALEVGRPLMGNSGIWGCLGMVSLSHPQGHPLPRRRVLLRVQRVLGAPAFEHVGERVRAPCAGAHPSTHLHAHPHPHPHGARTRTHAHTQAHSHRHPHTHRRTHTGTHTPTHAHTPTYTHTQTRAHTHAHTRTQTHARTTTPAGHGA
jgi:hypothetical protein